MFQFEQSLIINRHLELIFLKIINTSFQILYILHKPYAKGKSFSDFLDEFEFSVFQDNTSLNELTGVFSLLFPSQKEESK